MCVSQQHVLTLASGRRLAVTDLALALGHTYSLQLLARLVEGLAG
ncbi:MAG: hypothetical protein ACRYFX_00165 [Janthinobacterium lividum]